jgi:hypothetical protein
VTGILVDASALVALLDVSDASHARAVDTLRVIHDRLFTVWPALAEAMHLLGETPRGPDALCDMVDDGVLEPSPLAREDAGRMKELMRQYHDLPMDFADAALVRVAERDGLHRILSFDKHFRIYRLPKRGRFIVLP